MKKKFYITTSIPYLNGDPHLGFALEATQADSIARYHRVLEEDVFFLSGSDEHGATIVKAAEKSGKNPKDFVDGQVLKFVSLLQKLGISNDDFIRTSDQKRHWTGAQELWKKMQDAGDIYKGFYKGLYCVGHEAFITDKDLENGKCKLHKNEPEKIEEENYFFRLSKHTKKVKELIEKDEIKILPEFRKNEVLNMLDNAEDISFSRPAKDLSWGIPVPDDATQTMYVWCDALSNYLTAVGYGSKEFDFNNTPLLTKEGARGRYWPADVHVVGKDIIKFHAVFWPAMLLSAGLPLPKTIFVHGFINLKGEKMSKTVGNVVDPLPLIEKYDRDAVRFFLLHEVSTFGDSDYSEEHFHDVYEGLLVSRLGNLVSRVTKMIENVSGVEKSDAGELGAEKVQNKYHEFMKKYEIGEAIKLAWSFIHQLDEYIEQNKVYKLIKENPEDAKRKLGSLSESIKIISELIQPFLPETAEKIILALKNPSERVHLFPRIEK
ncbi:MAG TPA: methionine--tRNA ligase [Candidatus Paceibacterota bacterium]